MIYLIYTGMAYEWSVSYVLDIGDLSAADMAEAERRFWPLWNARPLQERRQDRAAAFVCWLLQTYPQIKQLRWDYTEIDTV